MEISEDQTTSVTRTPLPMSMSTELRVFGTFDPHPATPGLDRLRRTSTGYAGPTRYAGPAAAPATAVRQTRTGCAQSLKLGSRS